METSSTKQLGIIAKTSWKKTVARYTLPPGPRLLSPVPSSFVTLIVGVALGLNRQALFEKLALSL